MYGQKNSDQYDGDCIIQIDNIIYIGKIMPCYSHTANDLPVEQQAIWQIERVTYEEENQNGQTIGITKRMYPDGITDYRFQMSEAQNYTYAYRR